MFNSYNVYKVVDDLLQQSITGCCREGQNWFLCLKKTTIQHIEFSKTSIFPLTFLDFLVIFVLG